MKSENIKKYVKVLEIDKDKRYLLFIEADKVEDVEESRKFATDLRRNGFEVFVIVVDNLDSIKIIDFKKGNK